ncbi:DUF4209 domain-containing protein [Photobacterium sanguinicancri]|uniref:DUF4209 domain-containing protein n=1 Tax=Photobacterium TaxID=657 RepID=UPI0026E40F14|nr:DUF4209 domain-containing protein [Photobacterium sanguinicancri]MDO6500455.1 DUF4209 domain-containing protein [Photobacterium sanguinicancri]
MMNANEFILLVKAPFESGITNHNNEYNYAWKVLQLRDDNTATLDNHQVSLLNSLIYIIDHRIELNRLPLKNNGFWKIDKFDSSLIGDIQILVESINSIWLSAKFYDFLWSTEHIKNEGYISKAIDAYEQFPLQEIIHITNYWKRGLFLAKVSKRPKDKNRITQLLANNALSGGDTFIITRLLFEIDGLGPFASDLSQSLINQIDSAIEEKGYWLAVSYWQLLISICKKNRKLNISYEELTLSLSKTLQAWALQDERGNNFYVAADRYREAISLLQGLSNGFKEQNHINDTVASIEHHLVDVRNSIIKLNAATTIPIEIDLKPYFDSVDELIEGKSLNEIIKFPDLDYRHILKIKKREQSETLFSRLLFGSVSFTESDGRTLGKFASDSVEADRIDSYRTFIRSVNCMSQGFIYPALQKLRSELKINEDYFHNLTNSSAIIPQNQKSMVAKALYHGYQLDFSTALFILCPMVESILRFTLKEAGIPTITINKTTESEKSMSLLLGIASDYKILNREVIFKAEALFTSPFSYNFRNKVAHGLINDDSSNSLGAIYVWWLCYKWIYIYSDIQ